jgi:hypothetical protein
MSKTTNKFAQEVRERAVRMMLDHERDCRRAHNTLLAEIESVIPIDTAKSIDELTYRLYPRSRR